MTADFKTGRAGGLTPDQTLKLKAMWSQLLVHQGSAPKELSTVVTSSSTGSAPAAKKGGFLGFGRAAKTVDNASSQATGLAKSVSKITPEQLKNAIRFMSRADNPDNLLLRFLRARKWDVTKALEMFGDTLSWRVEANVEKLLQGGEEQAVADKDDGLILQFKTGKANLRGWDREGRPIVDVHVKLHDPKAQSEAAIERFTVFVIEEARLCLRDPIDTAAVIFDLSDFTLSNMDYAAVKFIITCFERHYPESLGFILIHKAPWIFQGVWNVIKGWLDPVVASKITFTRNYDDMVKFIEAEQIPKELGGTRAYEYKYAPPVVGENAAMKDTETRAKLESQREALFDQLDDLTIEWVKSAGDDKALDAKRNGLIKEIQANYWKLDKYVRARAIYDRDGTFGQFEETLIQPELEKAAFKSAAPAVSEDVKVEAVAAAAPAAVTA